MNESMNQTNEANSAVQYEPIQHNLASILPTTSEIGYLWSSYIAESMSVCMLKYFVQKSKDPDFKAIFQHALEISSQRILSLEGIFNSVGHPLPEAFGENDVNINANELFSESYLLTYTRLVNKFILLHYSQGFNASTRPDITNFFYTAINAAQDIIQKSTNALKVKGLLIKSPYVPIPDHTEYVHEKSYFGSFLDTHTRPLNALEISYLFDNIESKLILKTLNLGLSQVTKQENVKSHLQRGKRITHKQVEVLSSILKKEDLPVPSTSDFEITTSQDAPFSDRLIMFHSTVVTAYSISSYGLALANSARKDIAGAFGRLIAELLNYSKDGTEIMIENNWLERLPQAADRKEIVH